MFLADVVSVVGKRLIETWTGDETSRMLLAPPPALDVPPPGHAFDDEGRPITDVHRAHGEDVRDALRWDADQRRRHWMPNGPIGVRHGPHPPQPGDELSIEDWEWAYEAVVEPRESMSGARLALERVGSAIAEMATFDERDDRSITLIGRPVLGGPELTIPRSVWSTGPELRTRRLAACGLNVDQPFDPAAPTTHLLFVDPTRLDEALDAYAPANTFHAIDDVPEEWLATETVDRRWSQDANDRVRAVLAPELLKPDNRYWRTPQAQRFIANLVEFGSGYDAIVARVCGDLKKEAPPPGLRYGSLGVGGRPRHGLTLVRER